jgi:magnesium transporter
MRYNEKTLEEKCLSTIEECKPYLENGDVVWIDVNGLSNLDLLKQMGELFGIHQLQLEDILNLDQRPKAEEHGKNVLVILKTLEKKVDDWNVTVGQVSILISDQYVITFQEQTEDVFNSIRERIRKNLGRIRKMGNDYLVYALLDAVVDSYYLLLEQFSEHVNSLDEEVRERPSVETSHNIGSLKRELLRVRRFIWPLREVVHGLTRGEYKVIKKTTEIYLRDTYDSIIQLIDAIEILRDLVSGMFDSYLSSISFRMNKVMNVLTIIATIFIPLTFIAGIYGMNFQHMPELTWRFGYPLVIGIMVGIGVFMIVLFKRKKWL